MCIYKKCIQTIDVIEISEECRAATNDYFDNWNKLWFIETVIDYYKIRNCTISSLEVVLGIC